MCFFVRSLFVFSLFAVSLVFSCENEKVNVLVRNYWDYGGEGEFSARLKIAASNLGWEIEEELFRFENCPKNPKEFDFVINLTPGRVPYFPGIKNYGVFFHPEPPPILNKFGGLKSEYLGYDGYLFTLQNIEPIKQQFKKKGLILNYLPWYATVYSLQYRENIPKKLSFIISHWGNRDTDESYLKLYKLLDENTNYCTFFGNIKNKELYPNSYQGTIPFDGYSLINALSKAGINLILHSKIHNGAGIPSGRIFEATSASTVVICDMNPFVIKHFGDTVLYFDHTLDAESMFSQINNHMEWILTHEQEAMEKAKQAHQIFETKFVLERQLLDLKIMHDNIVVQEEKNIVVNHAV